jgi:sodium pump decarboxylase gamma subunit
MFSFEVQLLKDGLTVAVVGFTVVYVALIFLWGCMEIIGRIINGKAFAKKAEEGKPAVNQEITGEVTAAIGAALHMYFQDMHDEEQTVLTIRKANRNYSPWSSKIYSVHNLKEKFKRAS